MPEEADETDPAPPDADEADGAAVSEPAGDDDPETDGPTRDSRGADEHADDPPADDRDPSAPETQSPDADDSPTSPDADPADADPTATAVPGAGGESDAPDQGPEDDPDEGAEESSPTYGPGVPEDVRTYDRFTKIDGGTYERANEFLRDRTYITAREWAIARLCADFRTETGVEMTKIGENLPDLVPFMTDTYSPQAVNQARASFEEKVRKAGATFLYGAMSDFFTAEELDDVMYEATEVAKFLLEVEGVDLTVEEELEAEDQISEVMREVREHSAALRHDEVTCPECGHEIRADGE